jgi:hypothetical protein
MHHNQILLRVDNRRPNLVQSEVPQERKNGPEEVLESRPRSASLYHDEMKRGYRTLFGSSWAAYSHSRDTSVVSSPPGVRA